jgi:hypothetical protein
MSRPFPVRALTAVLLSLAVLLGGVSVASASDASLREKVVSVDKQYQKQVEALKFPKDPKSPTFGQEYTAASTKVQALLKTYRSDVSTEQASSDRGRRGRTLLLSSLRDLRSTLKALTPLIVKSAATAAAGGKDSPEDLAAAKKLGKALGQAAKDNMRSYKLLGLKVRKSALVNGASA